MKATVPLTPMGQNRVVLGFDHVQHRGPALRQNPLLEGHEGRTLAILGAEASDAPNDPNWADLSRYITDWYGLRFVSMSASEAIDLILADELPSETVISQSSATMQTALLVFSDQYVGRESVQGEPVHSLLPPISPPNLPCQTRPKSEMPESWSLKIIKSI